MLKRRFFLQTIWAVIFMLWAFPVLGEIIIDTAWVRTYDGPAGSWDEARAVLVDDSSNVYVTGSSAQNPGPEYNFDFLSIKYHPNGDTAWARRYNGPGNDWDVARTMAIDGIDFIYVAGWSGPWTDDYLVIKYGSGGDTAWTRRYSGPDPSYDQIYAMVIDGSRNICVTGGSNGDYTTIKYDPDGDTVWLRRYDGSGNYDNWAYAMAMDDSGNIYVTGESGEDYATIKYYANGDTAWVRRYQGPGGDIDRAYGIDVDPFGFVYVTGESRDTLTNYDYLTIKYNPDGDTIWSRRYNGPDSDWDAAHAVATDDSGNVFVTGNQGTIKYDNLGNQIWMSSNQGVDLTLDSSGNIYVTGVMTTKYDSDGNQVWNGPWGGVDIEIEVSGDIYVCGSVAGPGYSDFATVKYFQALRGDLNRDWRIDLGDVIHLLNYLFKTGTPPQYLVIGDCNCDGTVALGDAIYLLNYLFKGGPPPDCP